MPCIASRSRPLVRRGTLTTFRRRCGRASCRCANSEPHESPALTFTEAGRTKTLTLSASEVAEVAAARALPGGESRAQRRPKAGSPAFAADGPGAVAGERVR